MALQTTTGSASHLIADALDLRHRLPRLWAMLHTSRVDGWKARHVAKATRDLSIEAAAHVDRMVSDATTALPWTRFLPVLEARIKEADPVRAHFLEQQAAAERFVRLGRVTDAHLRKLSAQGDVIDLTVFKAAVDRIAEILGIQGDTDTIDIRRSKALGILARPDHAASLLAAYADDQPDPHLPSERTEPDRDAEPDASESPFDRPRKKNDQPNERSDSLAEKSKPWRSEGPIPSAIPDEPTASGTPPHPRPRPEP